MRSLDRCELRRCPIPSHTQRICFNWAPASDTGEYEYIPTAPGTSSKRCFKCAAKSAGSITTFEWVMAVLVCECFLALK